jgi:tetratricopeptide (TPR) repeat protein
MADHRLLALARQALGVVAASLCLLQASAAAEGLDAKPAARACAPETVPVGSAPAGEIQTLYDRFECHFSRGEYQESLPFLERVCRLTSSPRCLLNLGAVHHALRHCDAARSYYEKFLDRTPYDDEQNEAQQALEEIRAACPDAEGPVEPPEPFRRPPDEIPPMLPAPVAAERPAALAPRGLVSRAATLPAQLARGADGSASRRILAWSLLGAGSAAALATAVAAGCGARAESDFDSRNRANGELGLSDDAELRAIDQRGRSYNRLMLGFGVASGLLLGVGATLYVFELGPGSNVSVSGGESAQLRYRGRF